MTTPEPSIDEVFSTWFWSIIDGANKNRDRLETILRTLNRDQLIAFHNQFVTVAADLLALPSLAKPENEAWTEDNVQDVADWIVAQGRSYYDDVIQHPDNVPMGLTDAERPPTFSGVASRVFLDRFGTLIPSWDE